MTESDIASIEDETGLVLPAAYRNTLLNYPQPLIDAGDEHGQGPENYELYNNLKPLRIANCYESEYDDHCPDSFFFIGDNGCGEAFAIDTSDDSCPVYVFSPHVGEFEGTEDGKPGLLCATIGEYVERVKRGYKRG
ncbi:hypothetical protein FHS27_006593 [Rhodopirellula rubra]|uniref:Knr4/Smi1-like domain-containing protein n=2 Tax=Aporhodopirellula rubra TaxID=980271 RepID=A0A7W5HA34_9BACT|nr:hypothetical protein [Aporhodopirellula rubra]